jgi:DNA mismatch repair protein MutS2
MVLRRLWVALLFAFTIQLAVGFSLLVWRDRPSPKRTAHLYNNNQHNNNGDSQSSQGLTFLDTKGDNVRAGSDGYSVVRQPASRSKWDPEADPTFTVPLQLQQNSNNAVQQQQQLLQDDSQWWSSKSTIVGKKKNENVLVRSSNRSFVLDKQQKQQPSMDDDLDLFQRSFDTLDYPRVLLVLQQLCTTAPARAIVQQALFQPDNKNVDAKKRTVLDDNNRAYQPFTADTVQGAQERYRAVQEMKSLLQNNSYYQDEQNRKQSLQTLPFSGSFFDFDMYMNAVDRGRVLDGDDLYDISKMITAMERTVLWGQAAATQQEVGLVELPKLTSCIHVNATLQDLLLNAFDPKNQGRLSGTKFPLVGRLRARVKQLRGDIQSTLDGLLALPSIQSKLALESGGPLYSEVSGGRLVLPIQLAYASRIGIVHDTSRSGKTAYVEPTELIGPTNELRQAEGELRAEEARVWRLLTEQLIVNRVNLETSVMAIGQLDLVMARILVGDKLNGVVPVVKDDGVISLRNAKHPVLLLRQVTNVVGSDVDLGNGQVGLVLTGPNSGGKTVILKLLGLLAMMARGGIPVPASGEDIDQNDETTQYEPRVDFFNPVLADIGDIQSVGGDLSTFSGHMLVCREVLKNSGRNALVLMDEVGSGTDPNQGVALAQALLEALVETGARVAITTHFMQLKQLAASDDRFAVAGMQFVNGRPTYKLLPGIIGESFALSVAERLELPRAVINRANELLDSDTRQMGELIAELENQKAVVDNQVLELQEKKLEMARLEQQLKEEMIRLEKKQLIARREEAKKFSKMLQDKEELLENILVKLKQDPSRRVVAKSWDEIKLMKRDALKEAENIPSVLAAKRRAEQRIDAAAAELVPIADMQERPDLQPGDKVLICQKGPMLGWEGEVVKSSSGGRIDLKVNGMSLTLKLAQVALPVPGKTFAVAQTKSGSSKKKFDSAAERAIAMEKDEAKKTSIRVDTAKPVSKSMIRMESNTVDVRGCTFEESKEKTKTMFSTCLLNNRPVVYILHGHGTGGVLKNKIRTWLKAERPLVKAYAPADMADGGDAFTRVELR